MQTRNPIMDEFAKLTTGAMGLAQAAGEEAKAAFRAQTDRVAAEMDLVRRDEFDVLKAQIAALRDQLTVLNAAFAASQNPGGQNSEAKSPKKGTSTAGTPAGDAAG